ncbi:hypothetical protein HanXRQr2_Chr13g0569481 [Helianthus annuus]|uniref:Uncharacterized protein n=1 Tax=Helianthus annuus TaxID=4232 RepID=A0A9K3EEX9_HELAN|nr:hypothetical protein HanXRQr2_Chr13g0569481 [Helianthus annuus]
MRFCNPLQHDQACCIDDSCPWCMAHCGVGCSDCTWGDSPCIHHDFDHQTTADWGSCDRPSFSAETEFALKLNPCLKFHPISVYPH